MCALLHFEATRSHHLGAHFRHASVYHQHFLYPGCYGTHFAIEQPRSCISFRPPVHAVPPFSFFFSSGGRAREGFFSIALVDLFFGVVSAILLYLAFKVGQEPGTTARNG